MVFAIATAVLGHWTIAIFIGVMLSLSSQLVASLDAPMNVARLFLLSIQDQAPYLRWVPLLLGYSKPPELLLLDFHLDEQHRRISNNSTAVFAWITKSQGPLYGSKKARCTCEAMQQPSEDHGALPDGSAFGENTGWALLIHDLRQAEGHYEKFAAYASAPATKLLGPALTAQGTSSTLQSPLLQISIQDLGTIIRRLGMEWNVFKPDEGIVSATSRNRVLYSTFQPCIGILLHYTSKEDTAIYLSPPLLELLKEDIYIPTRQAAMLGFGILPGCRELDVPDYHIGSIEDIYHTLNQFDPTCKASQIVRDARGIVSASTFGFSDIIPMAAPMLRLRGSTITRIPVPAEYCVGHTYQTPGIRIFQYRLHEHIRETPGLEMDQREWVESELKDLMGDEATFAYPVPANGQSLKLLDHAHDCWDHTTSYFLALHTRNDRPLKYTDLLATHIKHAVNYWNDAWSNIREGKAREHYGHRDWIAEGAHCYWDYLPSIAVELRAKCGVEEKVVNEAWIMLMLRAMCWWKCHWMVEGEEMIGDERRVAARYWGSRQKVYIG